MLPQPPNRFRQGRRRIGKPGNRVANAARDRRMPSAFHTQTAPGRNFPAPQPAPPSFLPMTPQYEAGLRGLNDQYSAGKMGLMNQRNLIAPQLQAQNARLNTDQGFDTNRLKESLAERGIFNTGNDAAGMGGVSDYLYNRDIQIPYGRQRSDLATSAAQQYSQLGQQMSGLDLGYNQQLLELYLNRAADAASNIPSNVPQFSTGTRIIPGPVNKKTPRKTTIKKKRRNGRK